MIKFEELYNKINEMALPDNQIIKLAKNNNINTEKNTIKSLVKILLKNDYGLDKMTIKMLNINLTDIKRKEKRYK